MMLTCGEVCSNLMHISEIGILLVRQIFKSVHQVFIVSFVHSCCSCLVSLPVAGFQRESQNGQYEYEQSVATEVRCKSDEIPR